MNSADIAYNVSNLLSLQHTNKYNLIGSMLFEEIETYDCSNEGLDKNLIVIASKGDNQNYFDYFDYFDYFVDKNSIKII